MNPVVRVRLGPWLVLVGYRLGNRFSFSYEANGQRWWVIPGDA